MRQQKKKQTEGVVFGIRAVIEAIQSGKTINKVLVQRELKGELFKELWVLLQDHKITIQKVPFQKLNGITGKNHQGVIAFISPISYQNIEWIVPSIYEKGTDPLILILDRVKDVRNFGAIARTAECLGVHAIVVPVRDSALVNADAIKTSAGALHKIPVCRVINLKKTVSYLSEAGLTVVGCTEKAEKKISDHSLKGPMAIIMGSEEDGIDNKLLVKCDHLVKIPLIGTFHSDASIKMIDHMPTTEAALKNALQNDFEFWADNGEELNERFNAWLAK